MNPNETSQIPQEPSIFNVIGKTIRGGVTLGVIGAAIGAIAAGITGLVMGDMSSVASGIQGITGLDLGTTALGALGGGAVVGGVTGAIVGAPAGTVAGVNEVRSYYRNVAIPLAQQQAAVQGMQYGAQLEHQAEEHERASGNIRDIIEQREAQQQQGGKSWTSRTQHDLANMDPMGRA